MTIDMLRQKRRKKQLEKWTTWAIMAEAFFIALAPSLATVALMVGIVLTIWKFRLDGGRKFRHLPFDVPMILFVLLGALSILVSPDKAFSFYNYYNLVGVYALTYLLVGQNVDRQEQVKKILLAMAGSAFLVILYGFCQYIFGMDSSDVKWVDGAAFPELTRRVFSTWENPNILAGYLDAVLCILLGFFAKSGNSIQRAALVLGMILAAACLAMTYARGACLAIAVVFFFYGLAKSWRILFGCVAVILLAFLLDPALYDRIASVFTTVDTSSEMRLAFWEATVAMIQDHPFLGIGWGAYWMVYPEYDFYMQGAPIKIVHAHNIYLNYMAEIGIAGAVAFFWFFFGTMFLCLRAKIFPGETPTEPIFNEEGTGSFLSLVRGGRNDTSSPSEGEERIAAETAEDTAREAPKSAGEEVEPEETDSADGTAEETEATEQPASEEDQPKDEKEAEEDASGAGLQTEAGEDVPEESASEEPVPEEALETEAAFGENAVDDVQEAGGDHTPEKDEGDGTGEASEKEDSPKVVSLDAARSRMSGRAAAKESDGGEDIKEIADAGEDSASKAEDDDRCQEEEGAREEEGEAKEEGNRDRMGAGNPEKQDIRSLLRELTEEAEEADGEEEPEEEAETGRPMDDYWTELCTWEELRFRAGLSLGIGLAFISVALNGLTDDLLFNIPSSMLLWFLAALGAVNAAMEEPEKKHT